MKRMVALYMVKFLVVGLFVSAVPAMAQQRGNGAGSRFEDYFGRQSTTVQLATGSSVAEEGEDGPIDLSRLEIAKAFTEKGFAVSSKEGDIKDLWVTVKVFSRERPPRVGGYGDYYRYYYHQEPETIVFVSLENGDKDTKIVGRGDHTNPRKAAEEAAKNAAKKLKKMLGEFKPIIFLPLPE